MGELKFDLKFDTRKARHVADNGDLMHTTKMLYNALDRIEELEHALCEAKAMSLLNFQRYDSLMDAYMENETTWMEGTAWDDLGEEEKEFRIGLARRMLKAEGKL